MIADPHRAAKCLQAFPVYCPTCAYSATIAPPSETAISAIVERSQEIEWNYEREMLLRLEALVRRFPESLHRDKVRVTTCKAGANNQYYQVLDSRPLASQPVVTRRIEPDPEFDAGLAADPQLQAWMKHRSFLLYARLSMFAEKADYSGQYQMAELECPDCRRDYLAIERGTFERLV